MKITWLISFALLMTVSYSCTPDEVEPPEEQRTRPVPPPRATETLLLEMEIEFPDGSGRQQTVTDKGAVYLDNNARTITTYYSYMTDSMECRYFDNAWMLTKIVRYHRNHDRDPFIADSVVIARPAANVLDIRYERGGVSRCTVTATPEGGKNINIADSLGNPEYYRRFTINKDDLITELKFNYRGEGMTRKANYYKYNNSGQFITLIDTNVINTITYAYEHTIKKNSSTALPFVSILRKMVGPDMEWILHDDTEYQILPRFLNPFNEVFNNFTVLQNGLFTYHHFTMKGKYDGVNFSPTPGIPAIKTYEWVYDGQGKFTGVKMFSDGRFEREFRYKY